MNSLISNAKSRRNDLDKLKKRQHYCTQTFQWSEDMTSHLPWQQTYDKRTSK